MTQHTYMRAIKVLLKQSCADIPARSNTNFTDAWVINGRIFLTEEAAKGFPNRRGRLLERVQLEEAKQYAAEHPEILKVIRTEMGYKV